MGERVRHMLIKEFIQVFRDPRMRPLVFVMPILQLVVIGYAVTMDVRQVPTAVLDLDWTAETREVVRRFESSGYFRIVRRVDRADDVRDLIDRGVVKVALQFDPGFSTDLRRGRTAVLQVIVDGTDSNTASVVTNYAVRIVARYAEEVAAAGREVRRIAIAPSMEAMAAPQAAVDLRSRAWFNPDLQSRRFYVPGVIALLVMLSSLLLTSMAIVREREAGTMEQILVTPIRPIELVLGKTLPFALMGFVHVGLVTVVAVAWFEVPVRGSLLLLFVATGLYLLSTLGIGLFISTISRTQQQALMSTFFFFQPAMLLSGFVFPIANMPEAIQYLTLANPLRHFLVILRGIFLKGSGPAVLWEQMLALLIIGTVVFTVSTLRFRKRLS